jgi:hypothetical protein
MAVLSAGDNGTPVHSLEFLVRDLEGKVLAHEIVKIRDGELNQS